MEDDRPFPPVPTIRPEALENFSVFRETFLCEVCEVEENEVFRAFGNLQQALVYEGGRRWPYRYMDSTARYLQAALGDLRFLQGFLATHCQRTEDDRIGDREESRGDETVVKRHDALCDLGIELSGELGKLADRLEEAVGGWQYKKR